MNNKEYVDILNNIINNIGVKGFWFKLFCNTIMLYIPKNSADNKQPGNRGFGYWMSIKDMFMDKNDKDIVYVLRAVEKVKKIGDSRLKYIHDYLPCDYPGINEIGIDFLKCILDSGSFTEMKMKMQLMGYEI